MTIAPTPPIIPSTKISRNIPGDIFDKTNIDILSIPACIQSMGVDAHVKID